MGEINRVTLFGKLNSLAYKAIEGATLLCKMRGNPYVEMEHWLQQILNQQDSDLHRILQHFDVDSSRLTNDMTVALDRLPRGATSIADLSSHIEDAVERGWVYSTLMFGDPHVRTGHLMVGALKTPSLRNGLFHISRQFERIKPDVLSDDFVRIVSESPEELLRAGAAAHSTGNESIAATSGKQQALKKFAVNLTERAGRGEIDPITGRDQEIRQIVDILMRRRQNNPILTGEAGVGKTAVVEGFALRIAKGDVPPSLKDVSLLTLDIGLLQAGASMKGEFENRLRQVIDEVQASPKPIILFIDEAHTLIGAGGAAGTGDAANLLKPALARGTLRTIAATTWAEYKEHFEKDPALTRRFQVVQVHEPSEDKALLMVRGVASTLEKHHRIQLLDEALEAAVKLSHRYIPARQLPDKAVSLLDTACARVAISQHAVPPDVEDCRRRIETLEVERDIIGREQTIGIDIGTRWSDVEQGLRAERERLGGLEVRWNEEKKLVTQILELRKKLRAGGQIIDETETAAAPVAEANLSGEERQWLLGELHNLQIELHALQGDAPLIMPTVDAQAVSAVVADWTGIPVGRMVKNEVAAVLKLADTLNQRVIGQRHGLEMIAKRIRTARARLDNPEKPVGVFMLCGTSGIGKTETALALAESLYGGEHNLITINMSEYQEAHTVSTLKGAPPGYVGYGKGGVLTEAVRRRPYSVVLLDEIEKAHPDVHELFFQVFDKGWMEDGEGRHINFKNTIILLTTNIGSDLIMSKCRDPQQALYPEALTKMLRGPLLEVFPPALLGRLSIIPYFPLSDEMLADIVRLQLGRVGRRVQENHKVPFEFDEQVVQAIVSRCTELESGGRMIDTILTNSVLPHISEEFLRRMLEAKPVARVHIGVHEGEFEYQFE
ncbi:MAG: type VI secretion system ATPase TssH [Gammaproteobacteria bacterium]|nr:type VI secretion system ATPase TssH [Gammaproteobacteria bacterium]